MTSYIEIGGKQRPVRFGFAGLLEYEKRTGRNAVLDFQTLSEGLQSASVTMMVDLVLCGLLAGHRTERVSIEFDEYDVADWITDDIGAVERIMTAFVESFPQGGNAKAGPAKKAAAVPQQRIGKR
jgi:hypothetical protein